MWWVELEQKTITMLLKVRYNIVHMKCLIENAFSHIGWPS